MNETKEIGQARYEVTHIFKSDCNKSDVLKNRVLEKSKHILNLTESNTVMYNEFGGSIQSEEVL